MICWKVSHKYKLIDHIERKNIGIYGSLPFALLRYNIYIRKVDIK